MALAIGFSLALGGGAWFYDVLWPDVRAAWPHWKAASSPGMSKTLLWIERAARIGFSMAVLCWSTAFLFSLLCALLLVLPRIIAWSRKRGSLSHRLDWLARTLDGILRRDKVLGTVLNLLSSVGALAVLRIARRRPIDYWDAGVQAAVAAAVELVVLQILFAEGRLKWPPWRALSRE